jgi:hypothetical protein
VRQGICYSLERYGASGYFFHKIPVHKTHKYESNERHSLERFHAKILIIHVAIFEFKKISLFESEETF